MLELANQSQWSASIYPGWGEDRGYQYTVVVKQSFSFDLTGKINALPACDPIQQTDEYQGDPLASSLKAVNETAPFKKGGEIIVYGTAYPHKPKAVASSVKVEIRGETQWKKELVVSGTRTWLKGFMGIKASEASHLKPTPLCYEYAYGGSHPQNDALVVETNPIGIGYTGQGKNIENTKLPQIELTQHLISIPKDVPVTAGFAPIPAFWAPRNKIGADIDEQAAKIGDCYYGKNVAANLFNCAPEDQQMEKPFTGNECISLSGFFETVSTPVNLKLKIEKPDVILLDSEQEEYLSPILDTIIVNTDELKFHCIWRQAIPHKRTETEISWVYVRDEATTQKLLQESATA